MSAAARSTCAYVTGAATGNRSRARDEYVPTAIAPRRCADKMLLFALCLRE